MVDGITDLMYMSLSKLCELVIDREAWPCCSPWDCKESDRTEQLNNHNIVMASAIHQHESAISIHVSLPS